MTVVRHVDPSYSGMVFVGAGVLDFVDGTAEPDFNVTAKEAATLAGFGFTVNDGPNLTKHDDPGPVESAGVLDESEDTDDAEPDPDEDA